MSVTLQDLGASHTLCAAFAATGITSLYPWQAEAARIALSGASLVYTAPTGGGKTLVADIAMLSQLLHYKPPISCVKLWDKNDGRDKMQPRALVVLPYVALVHEKTRGLTALLSRTALQV